MSSITSVLINTNSAPQQQEEPASKADYADFEKLVTLTVEEYIETKKTHLDSLIFSKMKAELNATKALLLREFGLLKGLKCCASDFQERVRKGMQKLHKIADDASLEQIDFRTLTLQKIQDLKNSMFACQQCPKMGPADLNESSVVRETTYTFPDASTLKKCVMGATLPRSPEEYEKLEVIDAIAETFGGFIYAELGVGKDVAAIAEKKLPPTTNEVARIQEVLRLTEAVQDCGAKTTRRVIAENPLSDPPTIVYQVIEKPQQNKEVTIDG